MKWIKLSPTRTKNRDLDFLVKAPVLPNRFWFEKHGYNITIFKPANEGEPYYLKTDHEQWLKSFDEYYRGRFEVEKLEASEQVPENYRTLLQYGSGADTADATTEDMDAEEQEEETKKESVS